jgi:hypothetical protein
MLCRLERIGRELVRPNFQHNYGNWRVRIPSAGNPGGRKISVRFQRFNQLCGRLQPFIGVAPSGLNDRSVAALTRPLCKSTIAHPDRHALVKAIAMAAITINLLRAVTPRAACRRSSLEAARVCCEIYETLKRSFFMSNRRNKFGMEKLEDRQMMAGDIGAYVSGGDLYVNEAVGQAGQDNTVFMSTLANGKVRVTSITNLLNPQDFTVTGNVYVNLGGGNDRVDFDCDLVPPGPPNFNKFVHINVGSSTTPDDDRVNVWGAEVNGLMQIDTGGGNDHVFVNDATVAGDGLMINTGAGVDNVAVEDSDLDALVIHTYDSLAETDGDDIDVQRTGAGTVRARLGGGNDQFLVRSVHADNFDIDAGSGADTGALEYIRAADTVLARMGDGSDTLVIDHVTADDLRLLGESGLNDSLTRRGTNTFNTTTQTGWEWVDGMRRLQFGWDEYVPVGGTVRRPVFGGG